MKTETIQVTSKGEVVAEVEIERFENSDPSPDIMQVFYEAFGEDANAVTAFLNKAYEAEVIKRARKMATAPKITKEMETKVKKALKNDPEFLEYCVKKLGI